MSDFDAAAYEKASAGQTDLARRLVNSLDLRGDETVIDLGCGDGRVTAELAERLPRGRVVGIDSSPSMIEAANGRAASNLVFRLLDMMALDYIDFADVIVSANAAHWVHDHTRLLELTYTALKPGGAVQVQLRWRWERDGPHAAERGKFSSTSHRLP